MPRIRVRGSDRSASYSPNSLVLLHKDLIYDLDAPLKTDKMSELFISDDGELCISMKDGTHHTLQSKSNEDAARYHDAHRRKLRVLRQDHAKKSLKFAMDIQTALIEAQKKIQTAAKGLVEGQKRLHAEAKDIAGDYYGSFHAVPFQLDEISAGSLMASDFVSVLQMANDAVRSLESIATAAEPPLLPNETEELSAEEE
jgi:hypothetical protein